MNDDPSHGRTVDIMLHQVFVDDIQREHDDLDVSELNDLRPRTPSYRVTINGATIPGVRALHVQLHDPELTRPDDPDPRTEIMKHWGRDPELIIAAWHADRSALQHLAKHHEERAEALASDLQHAERENRRLRGDLERTIREAARHVDDDSRALGMMDAADLIRDARTS